MPIFDPDPTDNRVKTYIGEMRYEFKDTNGTAQGMESTLNVQVLDQDGRPMKGVHLRNVASKLTAAERSQLMAIFTRLRAEAVKELL